MILLPKVEREARNAHIVARAVGGEGYASISKDLHISIPQISTIVRAAGHDFTHRGLPLEKNPNWRGGRYDRPDGYVALRRPDHPRANSQNYVMEHILVAEQVLGKYLPPRARIHHVNRDRGDNRPANLVICENDSYHKLLHDRLTALEACGNPNSIRCQYCGTFDDADNLYLRPGTRQGYHARCVREYQKAAYHRRKQEAVCA